MSLSMRGNKLAAYSSVAAHGGVAANDPHLLILMLMDGAMERMAMARGCLEAGDVAQKVVLLQRVMSILSELRQSLDLERGGALAQNLRELYDYMERQLLRANVENKGTYIDEVRSLLTEIRQAWLAVPLELRGERAAAR
jgi:flagellar protein FliS